MAISTALATVLFTLVYIPTAHQQGRGTYDPRLDYNNDGIIDLNDLQALANAYGTTGTPMSDTWHFIMTFTANQSERALSPQFHIQGERWRIKWTFVAEYRYIPSFGENQFVIEWVRNSWTYLVVYGENESVKSILDVPIALIGRDLSQYRGLFQADCSGITFYSEANITGIQDVVDEGQFKVAIKNVLTPIVLTVEDYY